MPVPNATSLDAWISRLRVLLLGPQLLMFMPAASLGAFWLGGEGALILIALVLPVIFGVSGLVGAYGRYGKSRTDQVTGLTLRRDAVALTDEAIAENAMFSRPTAAIAIGLDNPEELEDRHGQTAKDAILLACANRLKGVLREGDIIARLDGLRFCIVLGQHPRVDLETLVQISTRIQRVIEDPISFDRTRLFVSCSVGFCASNKIQSECGEALIEAAEAAQADAAANGPGSLRAFAPEMRERARAQLVLSDELPRALENGQIIPWFQPQIVAKTGELIGFEVLARWDHPDRGIVPPAQFLSAVADQGLMDRLLEVMLYNSLGALNSWDAAGLDVPGISVNFSADELRDPEIVEKIGWELDRFDIASSRFTVEILETVIAMTANDTIFRNINALRDLGCQIDLDDFGTGHASIANIKRFDVDRIKIDRSFVTKIDTDSEQQNLVAAILTMAKSLKLETLAEGVETTGEHAVLRELGCGFIQGYGVAAPMPFVSVEPWVKEHRNRLAMIPKGAPDNAFLTGAFEAEATSKTA